jgi:hypothetical protein
MKPLIEHIEFQRIQQNRLLSGDSRVCKEIPCVSELFHKLIYVT